MYHFEEMLSVLSPVLFLIYSFSSHVFLSHTLSLNLCSIGGRVVPADVVHPWIDNDRGSRAQEIGELPLRRSKGTCHNSFHHVQHPESRLALAISAEGAVLEPTLEMERIRKVSKVSVLKHGKEYRKQRTENSINMQQKVHIRAAFLSWAREHRVRAVSLSDKRAKMI